jgi:branched-chain amino acid aminotransferase
MVVFLNGEFVPEERAVVSVSDRCFRYGDGLFETMLVRNRRCFRWREHMARLETGAAFLRIPLPFTAPQLEAFAAELLARNHVTNGLLRLQLSRGTGARGYAVTGNEKPLVVMSLHEAPPLASQRDEPWSLMVSSIRVAADSVASHKTANRLLNVLAATEARERGADEALLLNSAGHVAEGSSSNIFIVQERRITTARTSDGALPGITRAVVKELCSALKLNFEERAITLEEVLAADTCFLSLTSRGVVAVGSIDGRQVRRSEVVAALQEGLSELVVRECV